MNEKTFRYIKNQKWKEETVNKDGYDVVVDNFVFGRKHVNGNSSRYYICKTESCSSTLTIQDEIII